MVAKKPDFGPIARVFIGDGPPASSILTRVFSGHTKGSEWHLERATVYEPVASGMIQGGLISVSFTLTFFDIDVQSTKLALGNSLSVANIDDPISDQHFTMLVLSQNANSQRSFLFPDIQTNINALINLQKDDASRLPLTFTMLTDDVSEMNTKLYRMGPWSKLATILGARSPI